MADTLHPAQYTERTPKVQSVQADVPTIHSRSPRWARIGLGGACLLALVLTESVGLRSAVATPTRLTPEVESTPVIWRFFLESIYRLLGGDPRDLESVGDAQAVMIVAGLYNTQGIPMDLTREELVELTEAVVGLSAQPLPLLTLGPQATAVLIEMLTDMSHELQL